MKNTIHRTFYYSSRSAGTTDSIRSRSPGVLRRDAHAVRLFSPCRNAYVLAGLAHGLSNGTLRLSSRPHFQRTNRRPYCAGQGTQYRGLRNAAPTHARRSIKSTRDDIATRCCDSRDRTGNSGTVVLSLVHRPSAGIRSAFARGINGCLRAPILPPRASTRRVTRERFIVVGPGVVLEAV